MVKRQIELLNCEANQKVKRTMNNEPSENLIRVFSGAPWEKSVGYCRALRKGSFIFISGTTSIADDGSVYGPNDPYLQAKRCFEIIQRALNDLDASLTDVMRTRMFVTDASLWKEFGKAHAEFFGAHPPATTMVEVKALIDSKMLIEVEIDAIIWNPKS